MANLPDAAGDGVYRPLSFLALIGFVASCLFGGVVVLSALMAIIKGTAFFFPSWVLLLPAAAFILSWCGLSDVRNSEGTKAGQKLAVYGLWISLVTGSGYFAYSYFTGLALSQQALAFFMDKESDGGFFPRLQAGAQDEVELRRAFLLTMPATDRAGVSAEEKDTIERRFNKPGMDGAPGNFSRFRSHVLIQGIVLGGAQGVIEPLGVHDWNFEKNSYQVAYRFRIKTPEALSEVILTARSSEGESEGQSRQWFMDMTNIRQPLHEPTALGKGLKALREQAVAPLNQLEDVLRKRNKAMKLPDFPELDITDWSAFAPEQVQELKPRLKAIFSSTASDSKAWHLMLGRDKDSAAAQQDAKGRWTMSMPLTVVLGNEKGEMDSGVETTVVLRTKASFDPQTIAAGEPGAKTPGWEVQHVKFLRYQQKKH